MVSFVLTKEGKNMPNILDDLYYSFFKPQELSELKTSVEENHKVLIEPVPTAIIRSVSRSMATMSSPSASSFGTTSSAERI